MNRWHWWTSHFGWGVSNRAGSLCSYRHQLTANKYLIGTDWIPSFTAPASIGRWTPTGRCEGRVSLYEKYSKPSGHLAGTNGRFDEIGKHASKRKNSRTNLNSSFCRLFFICMLTKRLSTLVYICANMLLPTLSHEQGIRSELTFTGHRYKTVSCYLNSALICCKQWKLIMYLFCTKMHYVYRKRSNMFIVYCNTVRYIYKCKHSRLPTII